jgi:hypothetical protein
MLNYIKYHKEFIAFLKDNGAFHMFHNHYALNKKLPEIERRLPGIFPIDLSVYYETNDPVSWISNAFWWSGKDYELWQELHNKWNAKLGELKQIEYKS